MTGIRPGQKWISYAEPELGLGQITQVSDRQLSCRFDLAGEERTYTRAGAPLTRAQFNPGDIVATCDGLELKIESVEEREGLLFYRGTAAGQEFLVPEIDLDPHVRFSKPEERLFTNQIDDNNRFNLRYHSLVQRARLAGAKSRGLYGPRVSLVPHQFYIANEVANRFAPRVLLADEVGLGKTIEAGLILHQQLVTGRAGRVLIIVPAALTFQWFVEMIRRFNLQFTILDEARCQQITADNSSETEFAGLLSNPFEAQQLVLCSLDLFLNSSERVRQALESRWDLVVVDEAHHLHWHEGEASEEYQIVEALSSTSPGLLLLTATPEQLGREGHFARLRLLDPARYQDFAAFQEEEQRFGHLATLANALETSDGATKKEARNAIRQLVELPDTEEDEILISAMLDRHGTGRVLFRNVRSSVGGFPGRNVLTYPLPAGGYAPEHLEQLTPERDVHNWTSIDPRVSWLASLAESLSQKVLVICAEMETARTLEQYLHSSTSLRTAVFHEGMDLVARDRAAAYFSESERGAQVLVCSEIGSEGRNFQFASHLVLFDLPAGPDLLEQRVGRLDRIGQRSQITMHIPLLDGSRVARLFEWFHRGMDLFSGPNPAAQGIVDEIAGEFETGDLELLIEKTALLNRERSEKIERGRNRLLEMNSHRSHLSSELVNEISRCAGGPDLERYMERSFDAFGLESEPLGDNVFAVRPTELNARHSAVSAETSGRARYPELPEEGISITYDRDTALARENVAFFTWENPMVQQALDIALSDVTGNSTAIVIKHPRIKTGTLLLETIHVADCIAPAQINVERFMPPHIMRSLMTAELVDIAGSVKFSDFSETVDMPAETIRKMIGTTNESLREMLRSAVEIAAQKMTKLKQDAAASMQGELELELSRLRQLIKVNPNIRPEEIEWLELQQSELAAAIEGSVARLDALRLIICA